jgi:hypothetical protein
MVKTISALSAAEKKHLIHAADSLKDELRGSVLGSALRFKYQTQVTDSLTGGWYSILGTLASKNAKVAIFRDRWLGGERFDFWFGFWSDREIRIDALVNLVPTELKPKIRFNDTDWLDRAGISVMKGRPAKSRLIGPVREDYDGSEGGHFFGMYDVGKTFDTWRAAHFIASVINNAFSEEYAGVEGGAIHVEIERRLRCARVAEDRKRLDGYVCQVCGFSFSERYGEIGKHFAEAHHRIALSRLKGATNVGIGDLVTVCANCHRMLHRMPGSDTDVNRLKEFFNKPNGQREMP